MRGHTLIELAFVLLVFGAAATLLVPSARRLRDRSAVISARETVVGLLAEARLAAVERGKASVRIASVSGRAEAIAGAVPLRNVELAADFGVEVALGGGRPEVELAYDALGLGRVASQTISFRRGEAVAELVISSYGRVRRR